MRFLLLPFSFILAADPVSTLINDTSILLAPTPTSFSLSKKETDALVSRVQLQCRLNERGEKRCQGEQRPSSAKGTLILELIAPSKVDRSIVERFGYSEITPIPISTIITDYQKSNGLLSTSNLFDSSSKLKQFAQTTYGININLSNLVAALAQNEILFSQPSNWQSILSANANYMTVNDRIALVSNIGAYFSVFYDANKIKSNSTLSTTALLQSVQTNSPGGVCRDISLAQVQMLQLLGIKDAYVIGYNHINLGHATVLFRHPDTHEVMSMNYAEVYKGQAGSVAPNNPITDFSSKYYIWDSSGKLVTMLDSSLGALIKDAGNIAPPKLLGQAEYSINKVSFVLPSGKRGTVFNGLTSRNEQVRGIAYASSSDYSVGLAQVDGQARLANLHGTSPTSQTILFFGLQDTSDLKRFGSSAIGLDFKATGLYSQKSVKGSRGEDFDLNIEHALYARTALTLGQSKVSGRIRAPYMISQDITAPNTVVIRSDGLQAEVSSVTPLSKTERLMLDSVATMKEYGPSLAVWGTYRVNNHQLHAGATGPLGDIPEMFPESAKKGYIGYTHDQRIKYTIELNRNVSTDQTKVHFSAEIPL